MRGYNAGFEKGMRILSDELGGVVAAGEIEEQPAETILMEHWPRKWGYSATPDVHVSPE